MRTGEAVRRWSLAMGLAAALGVVALLANITTPDQMSGRANELMAARLVVSKLVNSGTAWAGIGVLAGWVVRGRGQAAWAGILAGEAALAVHYALGMLLNRLLEAPTAVFAGNEYWFVAAALFGAPLGLAGALARRDDALGTVAGLVVPVGALLEPFVRGHFRMPEIMPWPDRLAGAVSGAILLLFGLILGHRVFRRRMRTPAAEPVRVEVSEQP